MKLMQQTAFRSAVALALGTILLASLAVHGYGTDAHGVTQYLPDSATASLVGGLTPGACGILVGLGISVLVLGSSPFTVGLGAAFAISVGMHASAVLCLR